MPREKRKISAREFVGDIRGGLSGIDLMERYSLTQEQLKKVLQRLVDRGFITRMEMFELNSLSDSAVMQAFEGIEAAVSEQGKPVCLGRQPRINESDWVECTQVVHPDEPTLRNMLEGLLRETHTNIIGPSRLKRER